jgi:DNA-binding beta-propeller fold protein YncE
LVLGDALHRVSVLGGREGMPRSLGSVYGGAVTRYLGGSLRGEVSCVRLTATHSAKSCTNSVAVTHDGCTLLVSDYTYDGVTHAIHEFSLADGSRRRTLGGFGRGPLLNHPRQVWIAPDGFVFVADYGNDRVHVLTPRLEFHRGVDVGRHSCPYGVCANDDVIVVSEGGACCIAVFRRADGALVRRFGSLGSGDGQLRYPLALCFVSGYRHVAVADRNNDRVSVFSVDGEFIRQCGASILSRPSGIACSACDELVVADSGNNRVVVLGSSGEVLTTLGLGSYTSVSICSWAVVAHDADASRCVVFT